MTFTIYRKLIKKFSHDLEEKNNTLFSIIITMIYLLIYACILLGVLFWNKISTMYIYYVFALLVVVLLIFLDNLEQKGDSGLLRFLAYTPLKANKIIWYSYINRMWCNYLIIFDLYIPFIIFFFAGINPIDIVKLIVRFHLIIYCIIFLRLVLTLIQQIKVTTIVLNIFFIFILTFFSVVKENIAVYFWQTLDFLCIVIAFISIFFNKQLIDNLLIEKRKYHSKWWHQIIKLISRFTFLYKIKNKTILVTLFQTIWTNKKIISKYLQVLTVLLLMYNILNLLFTKRSDFEMLTSLSFLVPIITFYRIITNRILENEIGIDYFPWQNIEIKKIVDTFHILNTTFLWIISILLFSFSYNFTLTDILKSGILFMCYLSICLIFEIETPEKWYSQQEIDSLESKTNKLSWLVFLIVLSYSYLMEWLIKKSILLSILIAIIHFLFYYFRNFNNKFNQKKINKPNHKKTFTQIQ